MSITSINAPVDAAGIKKAIEDINNNFAYIASLYDAKKILKVRNSWTQKTYSNLPDNIKTQINNAVKAVDIAAVVPNDTIILCIADGNSIDCLVPFSISAYQEGNTATNALITNILVYQDLNNKISAIGYGPTITGITGSGGNLYWVYKDDSNKFFVTPNKSSSKLSGQIFIGYMEYDGTEREGLIAPIDTGAENRVRLSTDAVFGTSTVHSNTNADRYVTLAGISNPNITKVPNGSPAIIFDSQSKARIMWIGNLFWRGDKLCMYCGEGNRIELHLTMNDVLKETRKTSENSALTFGSNLKMYASRNQLILNVNNNFNINVPVIITNNRGQYNNADKDRELLNIDKKLEVGGIIVDGTRASDNYNSASVVANTITCGSILTIDNAFLQSPLAIDSQAESFYNIWTQAAALNPKVKSFNYTNSAVSYNTDSNAFIYDYLRLPMSHQRPDGNTKELIFDISRVYTGLKIRNITVPYKAVMSNGLSVALDIENYNKTLSIESNLVSLISESRVLYNHIKGLITTEAGTSWNNNKLLDSVIADTYPSLANYTGAFAIEQRSSDSISRYYSAYSKLLNTSSADEKECHIGSSVNSIYDLCKSTDSTILNYENLSTFKDYLSGGKTYIIDIRNIL